MKSNFSFVEKIDMECFKKLIDVEKRAKFEPFRIGTYIRRVMEYLCKCRIEKYNLVEPIIERTQAESPDLYSQLMILRDRDGFIAEMKNIKGNETLEPMPCFNITYIFGKKNYGVFLPTFLSEDKNTPENVKKYSWADNFLRQIGNDFTHDESPFVKKVFAKKYKNVIYALKVLQEYVRRFYNVDRSLVPYFSEDIMPISSYEIIKSCVPVDSFRTGCEKEFVARRFEAMTEESVGYSVIRQYAYVEDNSVLLKRAPDVYRTGDNCGALLNKVVILSNETKEENPLYLVAYDFKTDASELNSDFLSSLTFKERISLCLSYAETLSYFHNNCTPIYHRLLSSRCAYYADEREKFGRISTALIKFEYAKIADASVQTVLKGGTNEEMLSAMDDMRYIPDEWTTLKSATNEDWAKVDIYSLGVLFTDILMGKIGGYEDKDVMKSKELSPLMPLLSMMGDVSKLRPDINYVCETLKEILKNEN